MPLSNALIPGLVTHVELDALVGSTRTRERWEHKGLLPRGRWIKAFQKRVGIYPELVLARIVGGTDAGVAEAALRELGRHSERLIRSDLFDAIEEAVLEVIVRADRVGLRTDLLEYLEAHSLLEPLQLESRALADLVADSGIAFRGVIGKFVEWETLGALVVTNDDEELHLAAESVLGLVEPGIEVAVERVRVGSKTQDFVMPAGPLHANVASVPVAEDEPWEEMFASIDYTPIVVPQLEPTTEPGAGGDLVRPPRQVRIQIPVELYAGANPMVRSSARHAAA
jgi:hypothetical protein